MMIKERAVKWVVILFRNDFEIENETYYCYEDVEKITKALKWFLPKNEDYTIVVNSITTETKQQEKHYIK